MCKQHLACVIRHQHRYIYKYCMCSTAEKDEMTDFNPQLPAPIIKEKRVPRTYRLSRDTITLIHKALQTCPPFRTATSFVEEAVNQFAAYVLKK